MLPGYIKSFIRVKTPKHLATLIDSVRNQLSNRVLLYAIGTPSNATAHDIEDVVKVLTKTTTSSVGCLTAPVCSNEGFSLALAAFDKEACTVFSSLEVDRDTVQVGRWHTKARRDAPLDMDLPWNPTSREIGGVDGGEDYWVKARNKRIQVDLPKELGGFKSEDVLGLLYSTSSRSSILANTLLQRFSRAGLLGISASSTPFVTGLPHTMFRDGKVQSVGSVGIALTRKAGSDIQSEHRMVFTGLDEISHIMTVTDSEGNLIESLDHRNPARLLMDAFQVQGETLLNLKDDEDYYIGVYPGGYLPGSAPKRLYRILAGGPSRGSIAIENSSAPAAGTHVQFLKRRRQQYSPENVPLPVPPSVSAGTFACVVTEDSSTQSSYENERDDDDSTSFSTFLVGSENGFVMTTPKEDLDPWHCSVPGTGGCLEYFSEKERRALLSIPKGKPD